MVEVPPQGLDWVSLVEGLGELEPVSRKFSLTL